MGVLIAVGSVLAPTSARAAICKASGYEAKGRIPDDVLVEAGELASQGKYADARAAYLFVLARKPDDPAALFGLARIDSWEGCRALAEREYGRILEKHPRDSDVRAGWIDVLLWQGRYLEAEALIDRGLELDPKAPALMLRRARLLYWRGEATKAVALADEAQRLAPQDGDIAAERDRMYRGEVRLTGRMDKYPERFPNLYSLGIQVLQRFGRYEGYVGAQLLRRVGGDDRTSVIDARVPVGVIYHPAIGAAVGGEVAIGAPGEGIPDVALKGWVLAPLVLNVSGYLSYSFWHFDNSALVHILNPSLTLTVPPIDLRLGVGAWISVLNLPPAPNGTSTSDEALAVGLSAAAPITRRLEVGAMYSYGVQLDQNPSLLQILHFKSHVVTGYTDILFDRSKGIRPVFAFERRESPSGLIIGIFSAELGMYVRW